MATVFQSAIRLVTGQAKREELASELSDKLYAGRADKETMAELGIELVKPGGDQNAASKPLTLAAGATPGAKTGMLGAGPTAAAGKPEAKGLLSLQQPGAKPGAVAGKAAPGGATPNPRDEMLAQVYRKALANPELTLVPVVFLGVMVVHFARRRRSPEDEFTMPGLAIQAPSEAEAYEMKHAVHSLTAEEFELLVALIYQRQGYRVSMPAALSGGKGGDFLLQRKSERLLVQCKKLNQDHRVHVDRVRELQEAAVAAGATRGMYVVSCGFTWDARNFAKAKGVTVINARTLDALLTEARSKTEDEDLLAVAQWAPKFMGKVQMTPPLCPTCEAAMDQVTSSSGPMWVCSQRPDCRGRRNARKYSKPARVATTSPEPQEDAPVEDKPAAAAVAG